MEKQERSIALLIKANYKKLTPLEKTIADFFIKNDQLVDLSASTVAKKIFVSEASLSRFSQKLGYKGYREFIYHYKGLFNGAVKELAVNSRTVLNTYKELIENTYQLVDERQVARIADELSRAERVIVCGKGSSGYAAQEMEFRFMRVGVRIDSIIDADRIKMQAVFQNERCLVIGMSLSGNTAEVLYLLREAHKNGSRTVLMTSYKRDQFEDFCDEIVLVPTLRHMDHGNTISPQFPLLLIEDILYSNYIGQDQYKRETLHDSTLKALQNTSEKNSTL